MERVTFEKIALIRDANTANILELAELAAPGDTNFFKGADFQGADLRGLDLTGYDLTGATITGAICDEATRFLCTHTIALEYFRDYIWNTFFNMDLYTDRYEIGWNIFDETAREIFENGQYEEELACVEAIFGAVVSIRDNLRNRKYASIRNETKKIQDNIQGAMANRPPTKQATLEFLMMYYGTYRIPYAKLADINLLEILELEPKIERAVRYCDRLCDMTSHLLTFKPGQMTIR